MIDEHGAVGDPTAGPHQSLPPALGFGELFERQDLDGAAGVLAQMQTCCHHPRVVQHQQITGPDQLR